MILERMLNKNVLIHTNKLNYEDIIVGVGEDGIILASNIYIPFKNINEIKMI
jgi:hypothetical protein